MTHESLRNALAEARGNDAKEKTNQKAEYDQRMRTTPSELSEGDFVLLKAEKENKAKPALDPTPGWFCLVLLKLK